jgi:hypothetical protein
MHRTHSNTNQVAHGAQGNLAIRLFGSHRQLSGPHCRTAPSRKEKENKGEKKAKGMEINRRKVN